MKVALKDYIPLEEGMAVWLNSLWEKAVSPIMSKLNLAVDAGDYDEAVRILRDIDVQSIAQEAEPAIRNSSVAALSFGAMLAKRSDKILYKKQKLPPVLDHVVNSYTRSLEDIRTRAITSLVAIFDAQEIVQKADKGLFEAAPYSPPSVAVSLLKGSTLTAAQKLNAVVMGQAKSAIEASANLNTSRLVGFGFLDQQLADGVSVYQISAQLDGRVCGVCRTMHGKVFSTAPAHTHLLNLLMTDDPAALKVMAPFPSNSKAGVAALRAQTPEQMQANGVHAPPYHPSCRCRQVRKGTVPMKQALPVGVPDESKLPDIPRPQADKVKTLATKVLSATMRGAKSKFDKKLTAKEILALDKIFDNKMVNKWLRVCSGKGLVQKAESDFSFCSAFNPKQMGELVAQGQKGVKAWELDDDLKMWRIATGDFAKEMLDNISTLKGSVIHDKGFSLWGAKYNPVDADYVRIQVEAAKGTKAVKIGDQYAFPAGTKFQVTDTKVDKQGKWTVYTKVVDETQTAGAMTKANSDGVPNWWTESGLSSQEYYDSKNNGVSDESLWYDKENHIEASWMNDFEPYEFTPWPGVNAAKATKAVNETVEADIVPAGTLEKENLKKTLGDDYLHTDDLENIGPKVGGSIPGYKARDKSGTEWIIKKVANEDIARNEVLTGKLYEAMGIEVPDLRLVYGPNGETWVASKWVDGFEKVPQKLQSRDRLAGLYENFTVDAYLGNWDLVGADYDNIGLLNGRAFRVDVGGGLRFRAQGGLKTEQDFGNEVIDIEKMRNPNISPYVAKVFEDITENELRAGAMKVISLTADKLADIIDKYGPTSATARIDLFEKMLSRQEYIAKKYPKAETPVVVNTPKPVPEASERISSFEHAEVVEARVNGKAIRVDAVDVEDQQFLAHIETDASGNKQTVLTFKVRGDTAKKLNEETQSVGIGPDLKPSMAELSSLEDKIGDLEEALLKSIRRMAYSRDGRGSDLPFDSWLDITQNRFEELKKFVSGATKIEQDGLIDLVLHYEPWIERVSQAAKLGAANEDILPTGVMFLSFEKSLLKLKKIETTEVKTAWERVDGFTYEAKRVENGNVYLKGNTLYAGKQETTSHLRIEKRGLEITFVPESSNHFAMRNRVSVTVKGGDIDALRRAIDEAESIGVPTYRPSPEDEMIVYLTRASHTKKEMRDEADYIVKSSRPIETKIAMLRQNLKDQLGVTDEQIDMGFKPRAQAYSQGYEYQERPDLQGEVWDSLSKQYRLTHQMYGGAMNDIDIILGSGGRGAPTTDKIRRGVPLSGASPTADLHTGGAEYFFTRLQNMLSTEDSSYMTSSDTIVMKPDPLKRIGTNIYAGDTYGRVGEVDTYGEKSRFDFYEVQKYDTREWASVARRSDNEVTLKHGVSLFDTVDYIVVGDPAEIISMIKSKHNLTQWPDGRKLEDVIVSVTESRKRYTELKKEAGWVDPNEKYRATKDIKVPNWAAMAPQKYIDLKYAGGVESSIEQFFKDQGLHLKVDDVTTASLLMPKGQYPAWAFGYEKQYDKFSKTMSETTLMYKLIDLEKNSMAMPSWLNPAYKNQYKDYKKLGYKDAKLIESYSYWIKS